MNYLVQIQSKSEPSQTPDVMIVADFNVDEFLEEFADENRVFVFNKIKTYCTNERGKEEKMA